MIVVVSGLPRSGTSLMMQMLQAGGMQTLTDEIRMPDEDNPRGYFEFEKVKSLHKEASWLSETEGKAVKIVSVLLAELPPTHSYKVIFMLRHLDEILASQAQMLKRNRHSGIVPSDTEMRVHLERHLQKTQRFLEGAHHMETHWCDYNDLLTHQFESTAGLVQFLDPNLNQSAMAAAIDLSLYRQRH